MIGIYTGKNDEEYLNSLETCLKSEIDAMDDKDPYGILNLDKLNLKLKLFDIQSRNYMYGLIIKRLAHIAEHTV